ncbi:hypothetical protein V6N13_101543 [Hibiscus sabdariffa]|uniref:Uncharacterized protein n=1 Tax=Hibiscus sabdariffa TaxID=183260 RepID=A0ABR2QM26_9ROSI
MQLEGAAIELANDATRTFVDHVIVKPSIRTFGANMSDEKAQFNIEMKCFGCIRDATQGGATGEACTDQKLSLDLVLRQPIPYAGGVKLDLNLAPPTVEGVYI